MDLTNRIVIITGALLWMFLVSIVILLAWGAPDESIERIASLANYMGDNNNNPAKLIVTFGGLILILIAVIVVIIEVAPPSGGSLKIANVGAGQASIATEEVASLVEAELQRMPQVGHAAVTVNARGDKAEIDLELHVEPQADLSTTAEEACRRAEEVVAQRIGVAVARAPRVQLHYRELRVAQEQESAPASGAAAGPAASAPAQTSFGDRGSQPPAGESTHESSERSQEDRAPGA